MANIGGDATGKNAKENDRIYITHCTNNNNKWEE